MKLTPDIRNQITVTIDGNISSDFRHYVSSYTTSTGAVFTITGPLADALRRVSVSSLDEDQAEDAIVNESRSIARLCLDVDRLEEIITDSIDLDWTPRTAARAIVRAMKGGDT
jgi:hypothetical protein